MPTDDEMPARSRILISYRREDSDYAVGRLAEDLRQHFPGDQVFQDIASIDPGADFIEALDRALRTCAAVLVVIGTKWLTITDRKGRRRLDLPDDWVRHETAESLRTSEVRVFPVLLDAEMPSAEGLPDELKPLTRRQAFPLTARHWSNDLATLVQHLRKVPGLGTTPPSRTEAPQARPTQVRGEQVNRPAVSGPRQEAPQRRREKPSGDAAESHKADEVLELIQRSMMGRSKVVDEGTVEVIVGQPGSEQVLFWLHNEGPFVLFLDGKPVAEIAKGGKSTTLKVPAGRHTLQAAIRPTPLSLTGGGEGVLARQDAKPVRHRGPEGTYYEPSKMVDFEMIGGTSVRFYVRSDRSRPHVERCLLEATPTIVRP